MWPLHRVANAAGFYKAVCAENRVQIYTISLIENDLTDEDAGGFLILHGKHLRQEVRRICASAMRNKDLRNEPKGTG